ncbi:pirin family protein [Alistipes sp. OttesenSCG-928-B03]|nr:pirin family protein [Alistipes sp. OttesenSCG-928-B03]
MKKVLHKAMSRGHANHGWLDTHHTFSFANYYNPERIHFGMLRVLNDDIMAPGRGFGTHPHDNMEIISIPLEGELEHRDSLGNVSVIRKGEVQVMSAGTGLTHSEFNKNSDRPVKWLQIWIFPDRDDHEPRYDQIRIDRSTMHNRFMPIVVPRGQTGAPWINQDAWLHIGELDKGASVEYRLKDASHGVYAFVIKGEATIDGIHLSHRDGMGIWETDRITVTASAYSEVLLIEVPLNG